MSEASRAPDPLRSAVIVLQNAHALLLEVRLARIALETAEWLPAKEQPERLVYTALLRSLEDDLVGALERVHAELKASRGDAAEAWLRARLGGLADELDGR